MVNKKGQLTFFIIMVILIIVGVAIYFFVNQNTGEKEIVIDPEIAPIHSYVQECLREVTEDSIETVSIKGGIYEDNERNLDGVAIYFEEGINHMPTKEKIEQQISFYINDNLKLCTSGFSEFVNSDVKEGSIETTSEIEKGKVIIKTDYNLQITQNNKNFVLDRFNTEIDVRLDVVIDALNEYMEDQMKNENKKSICLSCLYYSAMRYDLYFKSVEIGEGVVFFTLIDFNTKLNDKVYNFNFINIYGSEIEEVTSDEILEE